MTSMGVESKQQKQARTGLRCIKSWVFVESFTFLISFENQKGYCHRLASEGTDTVFHALERDVLIRAYSGGLALRMFLKQKTDLNTSLLAYSKC